MKQNPASDILFLRLRHAVAEVQLVLFGLLVWCSDKLRDTWRNAEWRAGLLEELQHLRRAQAMLVFLAAQARLRTAGALAGNGGPACTTVCRRGRRRSGRPPNAPPGFARALYTHRRRVVWRIVASGSGLRGRLEALRAARDDFDALVARMASRLREGVRVAAHIMTQAPMERCAALARVEARYADTS